MRPPAAHRATTAHLQAAYPFVAASGVSPPGVYLGRDLFGASFCFDPWECYRQGLLTSPNMVVVGQIGRGKSTVVKSFLWRQQVLGRQAWVVDPKGEYGPLARAAGGQPVQIRPGGAVRLNPLDAPVSDPADAPRRRAELVCSLAAASLGRGLSPGERTAVELAVDDAARRATSPCLPHVVEALLDPSPQAGRAVHADAASLAADGRQVGLDLRRLVGGDLAGMFDGPTSATVDLSARLVVLDLSAVYGSDALGLVMTCATAWLQAAVTAGDGVQRLVAVDEAWAVLHDLAIARWLQAGFKLSRAFGVANVAVVHRLSDLRAAGGEGSEQQRLAEGLLADAETRVAFAQPPAEAGLARQLLGLTATEAELLPQLPRGVALWKVGERSFVVEHRVAPAEWALVDTDAAMRGREVAPGDG